MKAAIHLLTALLMQICLSGCVHEWPEDPYPREATATLRLEFDSDLPFYTLVEYNPQSRDTHPAADIPGRSDDRIPYRHTLRYTVNAYEPGTRTLVESRTFFKDDISTVDHEVTMTLPRGVYTIYVWADYTDAAAPDRNMYYSPADFAEITLSPSPHIGGTDFRDAARGSIEIDLRGGQGSEQWEDVHVAGTVRMERPLARFRFITTDLQEFLSRYEAAVAANEPSREPSKSPAAILSEYKVRLRYSGFMPSSYNIFTDAPADALTGSSFDGNMKVIDDSEVELGFDYVFVNHADASVDVAIELYSRHSGELVAACDPVTVPLRRSHLTEVRGRFLTATSTGGMGINPGFNGSFDIEIK